MLTVLLRQVLTLLLHRVANFAASDVASRDYHLVANPVLTVLLTMLRTLLLRMLPRVVTTLLLTVLPRRCQSCCEAGATVLPTKKTCFYGGVTGLSGRASEPLRLRMAGGRRWPAY